METLLQKAQRLGIKPIGQQPKKESGFIGSLVEKANERSDKLGQIYGSNQSIGSKALQAFGQGAGMGADIIGKGISAITPDFIEKPVMETITKGVQAVASTAPMRKFIASYQEMAAAHPELAGNIGAIGNILNLGANLSGASATATGAVKIGEKAAGILGKGVSKTAEGVGNASRFITSQATGLNPSTISQITKTSKFFTKNEMAMIDRNSIANKVKKAVEKRLDQLSETGKGYEIIRKSGESVSVPKGTIERVLSKYGIDVDNGKLITTAESVPISGADKKAIESFISQYGKEKLSGNAFLNARKSLSNMSKYDAAKTDISQKISRDLRSELDNIGKKSLSSLKELDEKYAPEVKLLSRIKKDILNPDGSLKDNAMSKLANLTGQGKEKVLERMEKIVPGITTDVNILRSIENIKELGGLKVGTYSRGVLIGGQAAFGNIPGALVTAIMTSPSVVVPLLRGFSKTKGISKKIIDSTIEKMSKGTKLLTNESNLVRDAIQAAALKLGSRIQQEEK